MFFFFFSSRRRHTRCGRDWSSDVCSSDLDREVRRLASEAMAAQVPDALALVLPLLESREDTAAAAVEALARSGRPELFARLRSHLVLLLADGLKAARASVRVA